MNDRTTDPTGLPYGNIYSAVEHELQQSIPPSPPPVSQEAGVSSVQKRMDDLISRAKADTRTLHQHLSTMRTELEVARVRVNAAMEAEIAAAERKAQEDLDALDAAFQKAAKPAQELLERYSRIMG